MSGNDLNKLRFLYMIKGVNYTIPEIEKCLSQTAKTHNISTEEVFTEIERFVYDDSRFEKTNGHVLYLKQNFAYEDYDVGVDDQAENKVEFSNQEYLSRDFRKFVTYRFPVFDQYSVIPRKFAKKSYWQIQKEINYSLPKLENLNWTNQTLSYARSNVVGKHIVACIIYPLFQSGLFGKAMQIVDVTGNIGADSITFAMESFVKHVKTYEILPKVYDMLVRNIDLYGLRYKISAVNKRFDYVVPNGSFVVIDPPYEADNNSGNFNLSIDTMPIFSVAQKVLDAGASCVLLSMPKTYRYNVKYALDMGQHVSVYQMGKVNNKMFLVMRWEDADRIGLIDFNHTLVTTDETKKGWNGKTDFYSCKAESAYKAEVD